MDTQEIRALLGKSIFERAQKYRKRILQSSCTTNEDGVRHLTALVQGSGPDCYYTQVWLRENGSFVSASCDCPYNQNGDGTYCKHIGALLLQDAEKNPPAPEKKPESIPAVRQFLNYYLPTLGEIITKYERVERSGVDMQDMTAKVSEYLDKIAAAMDKQYENLFQSDFLDMTVEMEAMTMACKRDGLLTEEELSSPDSEVNLTL